MEFSGRGICSTLNFQNRPDRLRDLRGADIAPPLTEIGVAGSLTEIGLNFARLRLRSGVMISAPAPGKMVGSDRLRLRIPG